MTTGVCTGGVGGAMPPTNPVYAPLCSARRMDTYWALPVTVKWSRRFRAQHSSVDSVQTGTSLP
jgi:hypothetical protein